MPLVRESQGIVSELAAGNPEKDNQYKLKKDRHWPRKDIFSFFSEWHLRLFTWHMISRCQLTECVV